MTASNSPRRARTKTVSAGSGPTTFTPAARHRATAGARISSSSDPIRPSLSCVRIERGERQARRVDAEPRQFAGGEPNRALDEVGRQRSRNVGQRDVDGRQHHSNRRRLEHHRDKRRAGEVREEIRVPAPRQAGHGESLLADGRRGDGIDSSLLRILDRTNDRVVRGATARRCGTTAIERRDRLVSAYTIGTHAASTPGSAAAFATISGPIPAGSPTVSATRGFMWRLYQRRATSYERRASERRTTSGALLPKRTCIDVRRRLGFTRGAMALSD